VRLECLVRLPAGRTLDSLETALGAASFRRRLTDRTSFELGEGNDAISGTLSMGGTAFDAQAKAPEDGPPAPADGRGNLPWWAWMALAGAALLLAAGSAALAFRVARAKAAPGAAAAGNEAARPAADA